MYRCLSQKTSLTTCRKSYESLNIKITTLRLKIKTLVEKTKINRNFKSI